MPTPRRIILGVTGSIAAYKAALLIRELQKAQVQVQVVMTKAAACFITPLSLQTLSGEPVFVEMFPENSPDALAHIKLVQTANAVLIAPATANTIAKLANGVADNLLSALCLASRLPLLIAPAMNSAMYTNPVTAANIETLKKRGAIFIEPACGELACGEEGMGRLAEISAIVAAVVQTLAGAGALAGIKVLISAGPTQEPIDAMRFISNRSSGKMGYALAQEALRRGAQVTLVSGPTALSAPSGVNFEAVQTAAQMQMALEKHLSDTQILIMAAAVADYAPVNPVKQKLEKSAALNLSLALTPDIIASIGKRSVKPFLAGFAAQSENLAENARQKLAAKGLDMIIANNINQAGSNENQITIIDKAGNLTEYPLMPKSECAGIIWDKIEQAIQSIKG